MSNLCTHWDDKGITCVNNQINTPVNNILNSKP